MSSPAAAPTPPEPGVPAIVSEPVLDIFAWLGERELTWTGWSMGVLTGTLCVLFGLRGIHAFWRGETPDKERAIPTLPFALGMLVFGAWVLWVFWNSKLPG